MPSVDAQRGFRTAPLQADVWTAAVARNDCPFDASSAVLTPLADGGDGGDGGDGRDGCDGWGAVALGGTDQATLGHGGVQEGQVGNGQVPAPVVFPGAQDVRLQPGHHRGRKLPTKLYLNRIHFFRPPLLAVPPLRAAQWTLPCVTCQPFSARSTHLMVARPHELRRAPPKPRHGLKAYGTFVFTRHLPPHWLRRLHFLCLPTAPVPFPAPLFVDRPAQLFQRVLLDESMMNADDRTALAAIGHRARLEQLARYRGLLISLRMHMDIQSIRSQGTNGES